MNARYSSCHWYSFVRSCQVTTQKGEASASNVMILREEISLKARVLFVPSRLEA